MHIKKINLEKETNIMVNRFKSINIVKVFFNMFMICFISAFCLLGVKSGYNVLKDTLRTTEQSARLHLYFY